MRFLLLPLRQSCRYEAELEAARAYDRAVLAHVGTGAPLNVRGCGHGGAASCPSIF